MKMYNIARKREAGETNKWQLPKDKQASSRKPRQGMV
jgi:hypothetical protein